MARARPDPGPSPRQAGDRTRPEPWREPARGGHPGPEHEARPGIELLRGLIDGEVPASPLSRLTGLRPVHAAEGRAEFTLPLSGWLAGLDGLVALGPLTLPADAAMASAAITRLPPGVGLTTSELALRQVRPAPARGLVTARATVLDRGPATTLIEVALTDDDGRLVAHGSSLCVELGVPEPGDGAATGQPVAAGHEGGESEFPGPATPDPWQRPVPTLELDGAAAAIGPIGLLTGLRLVSATGGRATCALPATRWLCAAPPRRVQGGAVATLAEAAMTTAIRTSALNGRSQPLELKLNFVRPLPSDGRDAVAHATVVHPGRRIAVATAEVRDADNRLIAVASGSAIARG